ncbi:hypothetical protein, partial [Pseudomonas syringae group genomosp. 7]|uniref:hypothetical protein n=1 Tax=Pseudomonas syringae group genomosp. 7 TaxID=251699 RepID=UPI00376F5E8C
WFWLWFRGCLDCGWCFGGFGGCGRWGGGVGGCGLGCVGRGVGRGGVWGGVGGWGFGLGRVVLVGVVVVVGGFLLGVGFGCWCV